MDRRVVATEWETTASPVDLISEEMITAPFARRRRRSEERKIPVEALRPSAPVIMNATATTRKSIPVICFVSIRHMMAPITPVTELNHIARRTILHYLPRWRYTK